MKVIILEYPRELFYELTSLWMSPPNENNKFYKKGGPLFLKDLEEFIELCS
jgi:hypothetical protein